MGEQRDSSITLNRLLLDSELNEDCFEAICKRSNILDLLNICNLDTSEENTFVPFMQKNVMRHILFDFGKIQSQQEIWSEDNVFEAFGRSMEKLKVDLTRESFNAFMQKVNRYCRSNCFTEVVIQSPNDSFEIITTGCNGTLLEYEGNKLPRDWLQVIPATLLNIRELRISHATKSFDGFRSLLGRLPNLEVFDYTGKLEIEVVAQELVWFCPNLRVLKYNFEHNELRYTIDDQFNIEPSFDNLTEIHLGMFGSQCQGVHNLLRFVPNIKLFDIHKLYLRQPPAAMRRIVQTLKNIIERRRRKAGNSGTAEDFVHLHLTHWQNTEFKAIKNTEFIRPTIIRRTF